MSAVPFNAPIEPGPEQRVTALVDVAAALIDAVQSTADETDLIAEHGSVKRYPTSATFKLKIDETGEVFTVMVTRGWGG